MRCMSVTMSRSAVFWPSVSLNGSTFRADSRIRSSTTTARRFAIGRVAPLAQDQPGLKQKELFEDQPLLRRACESR